MEQSLNTTWEEEENEDQLDEDVFEEEDIDDLNEDNDAEEDEDDEDDLDDSSEAVPMSSYSVYRRKYMLLMERINAIKQDNEVVARRIKEVKKLWKKSLKERRLIINKLDTYGDNFRNVPLVFPAEDETSKKIKDRKLKRLANSEEPLPGGSGRGRKTKGDKEKPPRDPNLPKRPQNPFFQYCKEKREEVAKEVLNTQGINLTKKELTKILANQWNTLDSDDKMIYNERFEVEKAGYNIKMEVYRKLRVENSDTNLNSLHRSSPPSQSLSNPPPSLTYDYDDTFDC